MYIHYLHTQCVHPHHTHTNALQVMSFNECGMDALTATPRPIVIVVASSTGDGDPPDNAAKSFVHLRYVVVCRVCCNVLSVL